MKCPHCNTEMINHTIEKRVMINLHGVSKEIDKEVLKDISICPKCAAVVKEK